MRNPDGKGFSHEHRVCFRKGRAGSKGRRETSAEARLISAGTTALDSEGIALPAGPRAYTKIGGAQTGLDNFP
jgi:hypothetical protein